MRIALTGGIGEGKTTILNWIAELGLTVASADAIARDLFDDPFVNDQIAALLGQSSPVNRDHLRMALTVDPDLRRKINALMHAPVMERILTGDAEVVEIPLLYEACLQMDFDEVWVVTCGPEEQLRRLALRYPGEDVSKYLRWQLPTRIKAVSSDVIFRTDAPEATTWKIVEKEVQRVRRNPVVCD